MDPSFFDRFGLYIEPLLLDADTCVQVRAAMDEAQQVEATIEDEGKYEVDRSHRKTRLAKVDTETLAIVSGPPQLAPRDPVRALRSRAPGMREAAVPRLRGG